MTMRKTVPLLFLVLLSVLSMGACSKTPQQRVADDFMQQYYVQTDLKKAQESADGLALDKIKNSILLTQGMTVDASAFHPMISFKLLESKIDGSESDFIYKVTIKPKEVALILKKTRLKVRKRENGIWKVTQFTDYPFDSP